MGKHEAPTPMKKRSSGSPKHAASEPTKGGFRLNVQDWKLPKLSLPHFGKESSEEEKEYLNEPALPPEDADVKIFPDPSEKTKETRPVEIPAADQSVEEAPAEKEENERVNTIKPEAEKPLGEAAADDEEDEEFDEEYDDEEEEEDTIPTGKKSFQLPKPDWQAARGFFERLASYNVSEAADAPKHKRTYSFNRYHVFITAGAALLFFLLWLLPTRGAVRFILYLIPFLFLGAYTVLDAVGEILDRVIPGRSLMITVAALGMLCLGEPRAAVFVMLMHRVFLLIEAYLYEKKAADFDRLNDLIPTSAVAETEEGLEKKDPKDIAPGDVLFVPAGDPVALDGIVLEGISTLDSSAFCGEGESIDVGVNSRVYAGCRNLTNPLRVRVTNTFTDSTVYRFVSRAKAAADSHPSRATLLETILSWVPLALAVLGVVIGLIVSLVTGAWRTWLYRGLLLIALGGCGDALLSARMAYFSGVVDTLKDGISFLDADSIDRFAGSDMMIFSKTGTITEGKYSVVAVYPVDYEEKDLLTIAALAECQSTHPIAAALREACGIDVHHRSDITLLEETPGRGIHTLFGGRNVYVGNSTLLLDHNIVFDVPSHKGTVIHVAVDNKYAGCIVLNDRVREAAFDSIEELRMRGIRAAVMLTGDVRSMARPIASSLSFDMVKCELSNESKMEALNYLRESKGNSAAISYVSCKDEDLELLQAADVGVGFNALSEYKLLGAASVLLTSNKIFQIPQSLFRAKRISMAALLSAAIMLGLELLVLILGLCGVISVWAALLVILLGRIGTLAYSIYFK